LVSRRSYQPAEVTEADMEMTCRHCNVGWDSDYEFCPSCKKNYGGSTYPDQHTAEEMNAAQEVIKEISQAFRLIRLNLGMSLSQGDLEGVILNNATMQAVRQQDTELDWWNISDEKLMRLESALSFLDDDGWLFYMPAYMVWTVSEWGRSPACAAD
jgi:hypothetical protein